MEKCQWQKAGTLSQVASLSKWCQQGFNRPMIQSAEQGEEEMEWEDETQAVEARRK